MDYFPIFIKLHQQPCLVIGAGEIAARKIHLLIKANAKITVLAETISPTITAINANYPLTILQKSFTNKDITLEQYRLIVSATNQRDLNEAVAHLAMAQNIPVNVVDNPDLCSFIFPAIVDRSPVIAAISSGGAAPVLARLLRAKIETIIAPKFAELATLAAKFRLPVKQHFTAAPQRRIFWERVLQGSIAELVFAGKQQQAEDKLTQLLSQADNIAAQGEVYLVGAGPGAADLLTFKALRLMQQADVVVYDRLVSQEILELARRDSEKIYVGKQRDNHSLEQTSINTLLVDLAQQGKRVVRLKGGDPFIFGRGGEEIETLMAHNISFQVVPGVTAASGCATYAGIPLTHRDHAQSCTFVTGHLKNGSVNLNWKQLTQPNQTVVIYMGLVGLEKICSRMIDYGSPKNLPIALIQQGTTQQQRVITGTLATLAEIVATENIQPPTLIIIGTVVKLHQQLAWFETN